MLPEQAGERHLDPGGERPGRDDPVEARSATPAGQEPAVAGTAASQIGHDPEPHQTR